MPKPDLWLAPQRRSIKADKPAPIAAPPSPPAHPETKADKPTKKKTPKAPWLAARFPANTLELLELDLDSTTRLLTEARIRLGRSKAQRAILVAEATLDQATLARFNAGIAWYGAMIGVLSHHRTQLRVQLRRQQGQQLQRSEAIAIAVDELLNPSLHAKVLARAEELIGRNSIDQQDRSGASEISLPNDPQPAADLADPMPEG